MKEFKLWEQMNKLRRVVELDVKILRIELCQRTTPVTQRNLRTTILDTQFFRRVRCTPPRAFKANAVFARVLPASNIMTREHIPTHAFYFFENKHNESTNVVFQTNIQISFMFDDFDISFILLCASHIYILFHFTSSHSQRLIFMLARDARRTDNSSVAHICLLYVLRFPKIKIEQTQWCAEEEKKTINLRTNSSLAFTALYNTIESRIHR